jgi:hypothetical protein
MVTIEFLKREYNTLGLYKLLDPEEEIERRLRKLASATRLIVRCCTHASQNLFNLGIELNGGDGRAEEWDQDENHGSRQYYLHHHPRRCTLRTDDRNWIYIFRELDAWKSNTVALTDAQLANLQALDTKRQMAESRNINRLTHLGAIFLPLGFAASLLSLGGDYFPGKTRFWVYWVISIPLFVLILAVWWLVPSVAKAWRQRKALPFSSQV